MYLPYVPPLGTPLYWGNEQSGTLPAAVRAYFAAATGDGYCTEDELRLVIDYLRYVIDAPCWQGPQIEALRANAKYLHSIEAVKRWILACLKEGIDPL